jgi:hypothetical protein
MECDWEVEFGPGAAVIDANWQGFVDLRLHPELAATLPETEKLPRLAAVLVGLNSSSAVWTAKCDVWLVPHVDPYELDAPPASVTHAVACYIDLLPAGTHAWTDLDSAIAWCKGQCETLRARRQPCCRVDLIVRNAIISMERLDVGITGYFTGCGLTLNDATQALSAAISLYAESFQPA